MLATLASRSAMERHIGNRIPFTSSAEHHTSINCMLIIILIHIKAIELVEDKKRETYSSNVLRQLNIEIKFLQVSTREPPATCSLESGRPSRGGCLVESNRKA